MSDIFVPEGQYDTIVIVGPGPSLTKEQCDYVLARGLFTIAVGDGYLLSPYSDILYHCDNQWWECHKSVPDFLGCMRVSLEKTRFSNVQRINPSKQRDGLTFEPSTVVTGGNSLYQAINLAVHYKPKTIILIGCDLKRASTGQYNVRGDHPSEIKGRAKFREFIKKISTLVKPLEELGITVYNCSIDSDLNCFRREDLKNVLQ